MKFHPLQLFAAATVLFIGCLMGMKALSDGHGAFLVILIPLVMFSVSAALFPRFFVGKVFSRRLFKIFFAVLMLFAAAAAVVSIIGILSKIFR